MNEADNQAGRIRKVLIADSDACGRRLDQWLAGQLAPGLSRSRIQALIGEGAVRLDGAAAGNGKRKLAGGETVSLIMPEPVASVPQGEAIALNILYEDEHLIVVDKPAGLVVHPGAGNQTGTLVNALIHHCGGKLSSLGGELRPGIVHRLDKDSSGVLVAAKTDAAHAALAQAFADHGRSGDLERSYCALVWGAPERQKGSIAASLARSRSDPTRRAVVADDRPGARHAVTHFTVKERFGTKNDSLPIASLLECRLETGRTHQIRVHMAHIGVPLIGDRDYGQAYRTKANRLGEPLASQVKGFSHQALHAFMLAFRHPASGTLMRFEAPIPADMAELIDGFRHWQW